MYPFEMYKDDKGINCVDWNDSLNEKKFITTTFNKDEIRECSKRFFQFFSTDDYLMRLNKNMNRDDKSLYDLVTNLYCMQKKFPEIDFPIGVVRYNENVIGQIIRYYENAKSLKDVAVFEDLSSLNKYFQRDEDSIRNLFIIYREILELLENLYDNDIAYLDVHAGNFVFYNDKIKIIDFEPGYISFGKMHYNELIVIRNFISLMTRILHAFNLYDKLSYFENEKTFTGMKKNLTLFENQVRRYSK